ncbi:MAG TPA: tRNA 2-selenouridine(34) synthase MnmH [Burkholderiales bacterium]|jgi:tRNA 2-selenouridine synthase|nr:tRNA 2-selenouridine(34) synthase MnmH [Burkholderiales bacterium]
MNQDTVTVAQLSEFDDIVDVRSPAEFALDHIPGAINCPVLDDDERARVGTLYVQVSPFEARKVGAALVARNIARSIEASFAGKPRNWRPLIYCWRGGQRSAAMSHVMRQIGWDVKRLAGGYKAYRHAVVAGIEAVAGKLSYRVICGLTGSGKTILLRHLERHGAQMLDLEQLAAHRGSLLGELPGERQPSQKMFESRLWQKLKGLDPRQPVFVESESRKVGNLRVPEALIARMWRSECVWLETALPVRVALLLRDYRHFTEDAQALCDKLDCLVALHGHEKINGWKEEVAGAQWSEFVTQILQEHYDPAYVKSIARNYPRLDSATYVRLVDGNDTDFGRAARALLEPALAETT